MRQRDSRSSSSGSRIDLGIKTGVPSSPRSLRSDGPAPERVRVPSSRQEDSTSLTIQLQNPHCTTSLKTKHAHALSRVDSLVFLWQPSTLATMTPRCTMCCYAVIAIPAVLAMRKADLVTALTDRDLATVGNVQTLRARLLEAMYDAPAPGGGANDGKKQDEGEDTDDDEDEDEKG